MSLVERNIESLPFVRAELNYLAPISGKPRTYAFDPPPGEPRRRGGCALATGHPTHATAAGTMGVSCPSGRSR